MATSTGLISYEDSLSMPENMLEEIIDGVSHIMPFPTIGHMVLLDFLTVFLKAIVSAEYRVFGNPFGLGIRKRPGFTYRGPDLVVVSADDFAARERDQYLWFTPELIVECLSPSNRKGSVSKLLENYESIGTPEVWLIYPESQNVEVYRLHDCRLVMEQNVTSGKIQPACANKGVPVEDLWNAFNS